MWVFTEPSCVPPGGVTLWKIKCPSNQEEAGTIPVLFYPCFFEKREKRALCFLFKESSTEIHLYGIHRVHLCLSWVAIGYTGQCWWQCWWIPDLNIQIGVLGKGWRPFIPPPPSLTFSLFFFNLKKKCLKRKLRFFSPTFYIRFPHRMPVELHRLKICACHFRHFPPNCKTFKYLSGRLVWNFILMGFMNKSPS